ncbi:MAG: hypothetical protein IJJ21_06555 [Firmicutes bacterium]|nr:hypothetical protein [Bacillota bacterium]
MMRLISQDLKYDIPYEHVMLHIAEETDKEAGTTEYFVFAKTLDEAEFWTLAVYHTEKARAEALRSLHIARGTDRCYYRFPSES